ncbi:MAG: outer membrane beta-barrel protein [Legionella sp.]|nr:outer membrane beta-barrel protein [Legionella sp.]
MKPLCRFLILSSLMFQSFAYALDPINGFYGGGLAEISHSPSKYMLIVPNTVLVGTVNNNPVGGGGGGMFGYRFHNFRAEAEVLFNYNSAKNLAIGSCRLLSPNVLTPIDVVTGTCTEDSFEVNKTGFKGHTTALYGLINGFYDIYTHESTCNIIPYVGLGFGGARIQNNIKLINTVTPIVTPVSTKMKASTTTSAAQGILGVSTFLDDFTWIGMDYRYLTTGALKAQNNFMLENNSRYALHTLNFFINFSFDNCTK